jgi:hypothetical protein
MTIDPFRYVPSPSETQAAVDHYAAALLAGDHEDDD